MGKSNNLNNVLKEIEKLTISSGELDEELKELGFSPSSIEKDVEEKIRELRKLTKQSIKPASQEFDPFMIAAGKAKKKTSYQGRSATAGGKDEEK